MNGRGKCLLIGTCISEGVEYFLRSSPEFMARYDLSCHWTNDNDKRLDLQTIFAEFDERCDVVIYHPPGWADWGNEDSYLSLIEAIPETAQRITIPYPVFTPLWPFHCHDPRNRTLGDRIGVHGCPVRYPYGDSYIVSRVQKGECKEAIMADYLAADVPALIDVDHIFKTVFAIQARKELETSVKVLEFILHNFQDAAAFNSMNHVGNSTLLHMANQILQQLDLPGLPLCILERTSLLVHPESPIHPSLIRYFDLKYVNEDSRYQVNRVQRLTYPEYLANYIDWV